MVAKLLRDEHPRAAAMSEFRIVDSEQPVGTGAETPMQDADRAGGGGERPNVERDPPNGPSTRRLSNCSPAKWLSKPIRSAAASSDPIVTLATCR